MSPPCSTWSRAVWANQLGPKPVRSREFPVGFPVAQRRAQRESWPRNLAGHAMHWNAGSGAFQYHLPLRTSRRLGVGSQWDAGKRLAAGSLAQGGQAAGDGHHRLSLHVGCTLLQTNLTFQSLAQRRHSEWVRNNRKQSTRRLVNTKPGRRNPCRSNREGPDGTGKPGRERCWIVCHERTRSEALSWRCSQGEQAPCLPRDLSDELGKEFLSLTTETELRGNLYRLALGCLMRKSGVPLETLSVVEPRQPFWLAAIGECLKIIGDLDMGAFGTGPSRSGVPFVSRGAWSFSKRRRNGGSTSRCRADEQIQPHICAWKTPLEVEEGEARNKCGDLPLKNTAQSCWPS